jgi:DNA-binding MarR family transcriptional regulator
LEDIGFIFSLGRVLKALRREMEARAEALDITAAQFHVLHRLLRGDGILISELTRDICSDGGTVTGLLDRLEARGLIRRERSREDRRAVHVFLTPAGRELEAPLTAALKAVNAQALEGFTTEEQGSLLRGLGKVAENLGA